MTVGVAALAAALAVFPSTKRLSATLTVCAPEYYQIDLVATRSVPGTAYAKGVGSVTFPSSPFSISLATDGSYRQQVTLDFERLSQPREGVYAVWFATTELDQVVPVGILDESMHAQGTVEWNRFIIAVSLEPSAAEVGDRWSGPIVMRGMSRSGMMHTMAGHGPFQEEKCAAYGY